MNIGSAYIVKRVMLERWGDKPCPHPQLEYVGDLALTPAQRFWFCLNCGRDVVPPEEPARSVTRPEETPVSEPAPDLGLIGKQRKR